MAQLHRELPASLPVSDQDADVLRNLVATLVSHNMQQYATMVVTKDGYPDLSSSSSRWKEMRRKNKLRIYRERPPPTPAKGQAPPFTPSLLLMGTLDGKLEDVMYGVVAATDADMKIKSTVVQDGLVDCKVLHELVGASLDDPFRHAAVKWRLYNNRDYVSLDATGSILSTATREKIGYNLTHSVAFPQLPSFEDVHGVARGNISMCALYRQKTPTTVEVYVRGFFDFGGKNEVANNIALQAIATQWLAFSRKVKCAQMKKLVWRLRKNSTDSSSGSSTGSSSCGSYGSSSASSSSSPTPGLCVLCRHSFGFLGTSRETCKSCLQTVCSRCCTKKRVCVMAPDGRTVLEKRRAFCSECITDVDGRDALSIAREQLLDGSSLLPDDADVVYGYRHGRAVSGDASDGDTTDEVAAKSTAQPIPRRHAVTPSRDWWTHSA